MRIIIVAGKVKFILQSNEKTIIIINSNSEMCLLWWRGFFNRSLSCRCYMVWIS